MIYIYLYNHYLYKLYLSLWSSCGVLSPLHVLFLSTYRSYIFVQLYIYIIFDIVPYWFKSQFICAKSIMLILSANYTYSRLWYGILNYVSSLKIMIDIMGLKDFVGPKGKFVMLRYYGYEWVCLKNHKTYLPGFLKLGVPCKSWW